MVKRRNKSLPLWPATRHRSFSGSELSAIFAKGGVQGMFEYKTLMQSANWGNEGKDLERILNSFGREGWELVYFDVSSGTLYCVFKRKK